MLLVITLPTPGKHGCFATLGSSCGCRTCQLQKSQLASPGSTGGPQAAATSGAWRERQQAGWSEPLWWGCWVPLPKKHYISVVIWRWLTWPGEALSVSPEWSPNSWKRMEAERQAKARPEDSPAPCAQGCAVHLRCPARSSPRRDLETSPAIIPRGRTLTEPCGRRNARGFQRRTELPSRERKKPPPGMANTLLKGPRAGLAQHTSSRQSNIISGQGENPQPKIDTLPSCRWV